MNSFFPLSKETIDALKVKAPGPQGKLAIPQEELVTLSSGAFFGTSQNAGMGWNPEFAHNTPMLILSTMGGLRDPDGTPVALGYHTGHFELDRMVRLAADRLKELKLVPHAGYVSDPCDGRTNGTPGMAHSLPWRNHAAIVYGDLIGSLPRRGGVLGIATCDKGLPAMMMAIAGARNLPGVVVPGGVTLLAEEGEDAGKVQTVPVRLALGEIDIDYAQDMGCRACATPGGGCQFLGTAATSQVVSEALGLSLTHSALSPSGQPIWEQLAVDSASALVSLYKRGITTKDILTKEAFQNAIVVHAAFGGSTNLLLHVPAIAYAAGIKRPAVDDWKIANSRVPRIVDVLPNGPKGYVTAFVYLAGGVPEVMLHLRELGLLNLDVLTVTGQTLGENLKQWEESERRKIVREKLFELTGVSADDVIMAPEVARKRGLTSTIVFPEGNLCPGGSVVKATAIDPSFCKDGVYRKVGAAKVFTTEDAAMAALKVPGAITSDSVVVLVCRDAAGAGFPETYQITSALKHASGLKGVALITDGRFSGVTTGACVGHIWPSALAGGPIGKILDGDQIEIVIDQKSLVGSVDLIGDKNTPVNQCSRNHGEKILNSRKLRDDLACDPELPMSVKLWAAMQDGTANGCVFDEEALIAKLKRP